VTRSLPAAIVTTAIALAASSVVSAEPGYTAVSTYPAGCPWMDPHKPPDQRARLLLAASTLGQKLRWLDEQAANTPAQTTFAGVTYPAQVPCTPTVVYTDGPDYVRGSPGVTVFPLN
jgi:beta-glucosidase